MALSHRAPPQRWQRSAHHRRLISSRCCRHAVAETTTRSRNDRDWGIAELTDRLLKKWVKIIIYFAHVCIFYQSNCEINEKLISKYLIKKKCVRISLITFKFPPTYEEQLLL